MTDTRDLKRKTATGFLWNAVGYVSYYLITLLGTSILSRLILPAEYGLQAMLAVLVSIFFFFVSLGLDFAIIQNRDLTEEDYSSFFWTNILLGLLVSALFFLTAPALAEFYGQSQLVSPARLYAVVFFIQAAGVIPQAILGKVFDFKQRAIAQVIAVIISYAVAVFMALKGFGIWTLLAQVLVYNFCHVVLNLMFVPWRPSWYFSFQSFYKIRSFGAYFLLFQFLDVLAIQIDSILVGKYLGAEDLAYFGRAVALVMMPVMGLGMIFTKTFYSFFAAIQHRVENLKEEFVKAGGLVMLIASPILLWMAVLSYDIVIVLFGEQWIPMVKILTILSLSSLVSCYFALTDSFMTATGNVKKIMRASFIEKAIYVVLILVGLQYGLMGLVYAKFAGIFVSGIIRFYILHQTIRLTITQWFYSLWKIFVSLLIMLLAALAIKSLLTTANSLISLIVTVAISGSIYIVSLYLLKYEALTSTIALLKDRFKIKE